MGTPDWDRAPRTRKDFVSIKGKSRSVGLFFLDSGGHSLYTEFVIRRKHREGYSYYKTKRFKKFVDRYAEFVKEYKDGIDYYANVDVIFNPELSWKILKYLENEHGLNPVPVIHYGTPMKWVDKHLENGYEFLGIGGLGQEVSKGMYFDWADRLFDRLCRNKDRLPVARTHGFAMASYELMTRYPWWSVDAASWAKLAGFGALFMPHKRNGKFDFGLPPYHLAVSFNSKAKALKNRHAYNITTGHRAILQEWLDEIGVPMGKVGPNNETLEYGVVSEYNARAVANLIYFERLCQWIPPYPRPFLLRPESGFVPPERFR